MTGKILDTEKKKIPGKNKITKDEHSEIDLQKAASTWTLWLEGNYPDEVKSGEITAELTPKELGQLAIVAEIFADFSKAQNQTEQLESWFGVFLKFVISHWFVGKGGFKMPPHPDVRFLFDNCGTYLQAWLDTAF